ncbi:hypothetical protein Syun_027298 [Stephania yunnanensis]|uniref:Uncharacterized protein n=1 Tax=Stephania yunnanensis TaxID=152371 RepID=A0AAP0EKF7_9MAGN
MSKEWVDLDQGSATQAQASGRTKVDLLLVFLDVADTVGDEGLGFGGHDVEGVFVVVVEAEAEGATARLEERQAVGVSKKRLDWRRARRWKGERRSERRWWAAELKRRSFTSTSILRGGEADGAVGFGGEVFVAVEVVEDGSCAGGGGGGAREINNGDEGLFCYRFE